MRIYIKSIVLIIVLLFLITFGVKNNQPTRLYYHFNIETLEIPLYGLVYLSIVIGIVVGMLVGVSTRFNLKRRVSALQRENRELREKLREAEEEEASAPSEIASAEKEL
jgi:uncharacterized integral membrane protein